MSSSFSPEFKAQVVAIARRDRRAALELAERCGISRVAIWRWVRQAEHAEHEPERSRDIVLGAAVVEDDDEIV